MNKITFVSTRIPYPPDVDGYTENIFHIIKTLKEEYHIFIRFVTFSKQHDNGFEKEFCKYVDELIFKKPTSKYFFPIIPFKYKKYNETNPIFFCDFNSGYYQSVFSGKCKILYSADSPTYYYSKRKDLKAHIFYWKYFVEESILYPKFRNVVFVSQNDLIYSQKRAKKRGKYIPIGYNLERGKVVEKKEFDLIFSGNFNYLPNKEAADSFLKENTIPLLHLFPNIKICFVGRNPSKTMQSYANDYPENIFVTGEVKSVEEYLGRAKIYISPLQSGSGMKNKILQAMASKLPIICTPESMSGFSNFNSKSVLLVQNMKSFLEEITILLNKDHKQLELLGKLNQEYFMKNYSWHSVVSNYYTKLFDL